ncbi:unnamed protein product [Heterobilharzia americana]|nr:unnamed protein product [Heterobilharzia americana]
MWNKIRIFNTTSNQCFCMVERLGTLRKGFPTNHRHSSTVAYSGSLLKIRWIARKNEQQGTVGMNQPRTYRSTNMQKEVEMDWAGDTLRRPTGDITHQARRFSGTRMGSDELGVLGEGDMEEIVRGRNESLWAVVEPGPKGFREHSSLETCY